LLTVPCWNWFATFSDTAFFFFIIQIGTHIGRYTVEPGKRETVLFKFQKYAKEINKQNEVLFDEEDLKNLEKYFEEVQVLYQKYAPLMVDEKTKLCMEKLAASKKLFISSNILQSAVSSMANHCDPPAAAPALLTAANPIEERQYNGGGLLFTFGALTFDYDKSGRDVILMFGDYPHAVEECC